MNYLHSLYETEFKTQYYNHMHSFKNRSKGKARTKLYFVWECKDSAIHWKSVCRASSYRHGNDHCTLCLTENFVVFTADLKTTINNRNKLINKYRHRNKFKLKNLKPRLPVLPSNPILTSLLCALIQLYIDVICGVVYF